MPVPTIKTDIKYIKGVGPAKSALFKTLGIESVEDLLLYYPRMWLDRRLETEKLPPYVEKDYVFCGKVVRAFTHYTSSPLMIFEAVIENGASKAHAILFRHRNPRFDIMSKIKTDFQVGKELFIIGKQEPDFLENKIRVEEYYPVNYPQIKRHVNSLIPVYSSTEKLSQKFFRETVFNAISSHINLFEEILPKKLLIKRALPTRNEAIANIHFPKNLKFLIKARERLVYEEFLLMLCAWEFKKRQISSSDKNRRYEIKRHLLTPFKENLGFSFTNAQKKAINEIFSDILSPKPMSRLLQGDVGCGKTVVALSAALLAAENGFQTAFMAPTEILARQHFETFSKLLSHLPVKVALLTSSLSRKEKDLIQAETASGEIDILIGTHAIIEKEIVFKSLSLAIIDEQHKFGVRQRAALRQKGENTDMLIMTATPIPRTLALSLYGDLELSSIDEMPPGRKPVKTWLVSQEEAFSKLKEEILRGGQGYVVYPVIEETNGEIKSLKKEFEKFKMNFPLIKAGMIYGTMKTEEKNITMSKFLNSEIKVLFASSVIEVGIDVKNASTMIIQNAERFGMASLHQLRGRIGRSEKASNCFLVSENPSKEALERLNAVCRTNNGFELSEKDAYLRGSGELMGVKQHGELELSIANPVLDKNILFLAIQDRDELFATDPDLRSRENTILRNKVIEMYGSKWNLIDAG